MDLRDREDSKSFTITDNNASSTILEMKHSIRQILICCVAHCLVIHAGINMAFSAVLLPQLEDNPDKEILLSKSISSWIASLVAISLPLGSMCSGPIMDQYGRRKGCIIATIPFCVAWLFQANATAVWHLYIGRLLCGFSGGLTTVSLVYVSEISHTSLRSALLSLNSVFVCFGILLTCLLGILLPWRQIAFVNFVIALLTLIAAVLILPESPYWFISFRNDRNAARKVIARLYTADNMRDAQMRIILDQTTPNEPTRTDNSSSKFVIGLNYFKEPTVLKPMLLLMVLFVIQQLSGAYVIIFYAVDIFRQIGTYQGQQSNINDYVALVLLGVLRFIMSILLTFLSQKVGRRLLMLMSESAMAITIFVASLCLIWVPKSSDFACLCVLGYVCFSSFGLLVVPWTLIGELLPVKVRGVAGGILVSFAYILMFAAVKMYPFISDVLSIPELFLLIAVFNILGCLFVYFFIPETLNKSFTEIQNVFKAS